MLCFAFGSFGPRHTVSAATGINHQINFQGKLVNPTGTNVTDGSYSIIFSIYTVASGGANIWTETQSVTVTNGIFQVNLGSVTALPGSVDFNTDNIYLGIKVGADAEMTPRIQFTSVPQAFNSEKLGGLDKTGFIQNQTGSTQTADFKISGTGNIGTSLTTPLLQAAAATGLTITGNAASTWSTSAGNITLQAGGGTISLGSTTTLSSSGALTISGGTTLALVSTGANAISLDSGTTGAINIGTNANAKTITLGNTTGASSTIIHMGTGGLSFGDDAVTGTINIGGVSANGADTINIATNATTQDAILIGSTHASSTSKIQAGASSVAVANSGVTIQTTANSASALVIQNSAGGSVLTSNTTDSSLTVNQGGLFVNGLANPSTPSLSSVGTTGTLAAATYYYRVSAVGPSGETVAVASSPTSVTTAGSTSKNTITWTTVTGATSYTVYRSTDNATWFYNTIASPTVTLVDNGSTYSWATSGTPNLYYNFTGRVQLNPGAPVVFDGATLGASIRYDQTSKNVTFTDTYAGGAFSVQADSFVFQDTTGYVQDLNISNSGATLFKNRVNSINGFQIQPSASATSVLDVDTTFSRVGIGLNAPGYKLDVAGDINTSGAFRVGGTLGATTTCSGGQFLQNSVTTGGITTGGTCATASSTGVTTVGAFSASSQVNGASISGVTITFGPADTTNPGMVSTGTQTFAGNKNFTGSVGVSTSNPTNVLSVSPLQYNTGTISQSASTTVIGAGTTFTSAMVGSELVYADGTKDTIASFTDATHVVVGTSRTHASSNYSIQYAGLQVTSAGKVGIGTANPTAALTVLSATNANTIGAELFTGSYTFGAAAGWTSISGTGSSAVGTHTASGGTTALAASPSLALPAGMYRVTWSVNTTSGSGNLQPSIAGTNVPAATLWNASLTQTSNVTTGSTGNLIFTPTTDWAGTLSNVTVELLTPFNPTLNVKNSTGTTLLEVRTADVDSTFYGLNAGSVNSGSGVGNSAFGSNVLAGNSSGTYNVGVGSNALKVNSTGSYNVGLGYKALTGNSSGSYNTAIGEEALQNNFAANYNVAVGYQSLFSNLTATGNAAFGVQALLNNNSDYETALGYAALANNTSGYANTAVGASSLYYNTSGSYNTATGLNSLVNNTTGNQNTAQGYNAGYSTTTGSFNLALGSAALYYNQAGSNNVGLGTGALYSTTADANIGIGRRALYSNTTGTNNLAIGYYSGYQDPNVASFVSGTTLQNAAAIGYGSQVQASNSLILGGQGTLQTNVGIGTTSPSNVLSVSPYSSTFTAGTASVTSGAAAVTGVGTAWNGAMTGNEFIFADGTKYTVLSVASATSLTLSTNATATESGSAFRVHIPALQVMSNGNVGAGVLYADAALSVRTQGQNAIVNIYGVSSSNDYGVIQVSTNGGLTNPSGRALILQPNGGNVGIATSSASNILSVSPAQYSTGTAGTGGVSSTTITGSGTTWTAAMVNSEIIFANGAKSTVTGFTSATSITVGSSVTVPTGTNYVIQYAGLQVNSSGAVGIGTSAPDAPLAVRSQGQNAVVNIYGIGAATDYGVIQVSSLGGLTNPSSRALILQPNAGNVGIGSASANYRLDVQGGDINTSAFYRIGGSIVLNTTTATGNVFVGPSAGNTTTTSNYNTAVGNSALNSLAGSIDGNSAFGYSALKLNVTGDKNTAMGAFALQNATGVKSTAVGYNAGNQVTSGTLNTYLGFKAGDVDPDGFNSYYGLTNSSAIGAYAQVQKDNSLVLGGAGTNQVNVGIGTTTPLNPLSVMPMQYNTGTASQSGTTVTGVGTSFTAAMVGSQFVWSNGPIAPLKITSVTDATHLVVDVSQTVSSMNYRIHYLGLQVTSTGAVGIGTTSPSATLTVAGTAQIQSNSATALQVQTNTAVPVLTVDTQNSQLLLRSKNDIASLGSNLIASQDFTNATYWTGCNGGAGGWSGTTTTATHNTGNTTTCSASATNFTTVANATYRVQFTLSSNTADTNTVIVNLNGQHSPAIGQTGSNTESVVLTMPSYTGQLSFQPSTNFNGSITSISIKLISTTTNVLALQNVDGSNGVELRAGGSGKDTTFIGLNAGVSNFVSENTAVGAYAMQSNYNGGNNAALGSYAMYNNVDGSDNIAVGYASLQNNLNGGNNIALGEAALYSNTTGNYNTAVGRDAVSSVTTASGNSGIGYHSLNNAIGGFNTALGYSSGTTITTGTNNTFLGNLANASSGGLTNAGAIGSNAYVSQSNSIVLGSINGVNGATSGTNVGIGTTAPSNLLSVSSLQTNAGTAGTGGVSSTTVTGVGTSFTSGMVGSEIIFAGGTRAQIMTYVSATSITVNPAVTIAAGTAFTIQTIGLQVASSGNVGIGTESPVSPFNVVSETAGSGSPTIVAALTGRTVNGAGNNSGPALSFNTSIFNYNMPISSIAGVFDNLGTGYGDSGGLAFSTRNGDNTFSGTLTERLRIASNGNVGIGTAAPGYSLEINTSNTYAARIYASSTNGPSGSGIYLQQRSNTANNGFGLITLDANSCQVSAAGTTILDHTNHIAELSFQTNGGGGCATTERLKIGSGGLLKISAYGAGTLTTDASGNVTASSDERLKNIQGAFTDGLSAINALNPILYHWNQLSGMETQGTYAGFSAQNVKSVIPEAVNTDSRGYLTLQDRPILAAAVNAIKEEDTKTTALQQSMNSITAHLLQDGSASFSALSIDGNAKMGSLQVMGSADIAANLHIGGDLTVVGSASIGGNLSVGGDLTVQGLTNVQDIIVGGHIVGKGNAPALVVGAAAGTSAVDQPAPAVSVDGTDSAGTITVTSGMTQADPGVLAELTFAKAFATGTNVKVALTPTSASALDIRVYVEKTATGFRIVSRDKLAPGVQYSFDYIVIGSQQVAQGGTQ